MKRWRKHVRRGEGVWLGSSGLVTQQTTVYTKITFKMPFTKKKNTIIIIIIIINIIITILFEARCSYLIKGGWMAVNASLLPTN